MKTGGGFIESWRSWRRFARLPEGDRRIVFYSESGQDWHHLAPLVNYLAEVRGKRVCYVSSDPDDPGLASTHSLISAFFVREGLLQILFFQFLKADVLVLTMLDLGMMQLKRSVNPVHYIYVFHAMGSTHMVDYETSYDGYDTIFCTGPHQKREIRAREELAGLSPKNLFDHGYARFDALSGLKAGDKEAVPSRSGKATLLLAPTWGAGNILDVCGEALIEALLTGGFKVILRPHHQSVKTAPELVDSLKRRFGGHPDFVYEGRMGDTDSLFESDLLICDWSSMSIEYALALEKPVLFIDVPRRVKNPEYTRLGMEPLEVAIREKVGRVLSPDEVGRAPELVRELLADPEGFKGAVSRLREEIVFNPGESVRAGGDEIVRIAGAVARGKRGDGEKDA